MEQQGQIPRAERFPTDGEILYSEVAHLAWHAGSLVNVSSSGLLFEGSHPVRAGTPMEMTFTLPRRIFSDEAEQVYCTGLVVRDAPGMGSGEEQVSHMAARITTWQRLAELQ